MALARRSLGDTGIEVSVSALGGRDFAEPQMDLTQMRLVLSAAADMGVNFVDTANVYGRHRGEAEAMLGEALGSRRDEWVIATKFGLRAPHGESARGHIRRQLEESLQRLGTDRVDLFQVHFARDTVAAEDLMSELDELVREGKVRAVGACNFSAWRLSETRHLTSERGWRHFATIQSTYHLRARHIEAEVMPYAARSGMAMIAYRPLTPAGSDVYSGSDGAMLERLNAVAERFERSLNDLELAWLASRPCVATVVAGARNVEHMRQNVAACAWRLDDAVLDEIDSITAPEGVPSPERLRTLHGRWLAGDIRHVLAGSAVSGGADVEGSTGP